MRRSDRKCGIQCALAVLSLLIALIFGTQCARIPCPSGDPDCSVAGLAALASIVNRSVYIVGTNDGQLAFSQDDGQSWSIVNLGNINFVGYGAGEASGVYFVFGDNGGGSGSFYTSTDLLQWSGPFNLAGTGPLTFGDTDGLSMYAIEGGTSKLFQLHGDGTNTNVTTYGGTPAGITLFEYYDNLWFLGDTSPDPVLSYGVAPLALGSPSVSTPTDQVSGIVRIANNYFAIGSGAVEAFVTNSGSLDDWTPYAPGFFVNAICDNGQIAWAAGTLGMAYPVTDGQTYGSGINTGTANDLSDVACGGSTFIFIPTVSADWPISRDSGASWQLIPNPMPVTIPQFIQRFP